MLTHLPPTATGPEIAELLRRDGGVIVDDLATDEGLDTFFGEMQPWTDATGPGTDEFTAATRAARGAACTLEDSAGSRDALDGAGRLRRLSQSRDQLPTSSHPDHRHRAG